MARLNALALLGLLALFCAGMNMADPFEGTKWKVQVSPDEDARRAGEKDFDDTLVFKGGMFTAEEFVKHGFKPVAYDEDTRRMGPATFTAEPKSQTSGSTKWTGMVTATAIKGELVWTKKDGTVLNYTYTGERVSK